MSDEEKPKPVLDQPLKSSMEILSELFSTFHAKPPVIIKKEKGEEGSKKHKKSKKKHKHKDKKHKKKDKKKKSKDSSSGSDESDIDLAKLLIKQEKEACENKIKIEGTDVEFNISSLKTDENKDISSEDVKDKTNKPNTNKISINISTVAEQLSGKNTEDGEIESDSGSDKKDKKHKKRKHKSDHDKSRKKRRSESKERVKHKEKAYTEKSNGKDNIYKYDDLSEKLHKSREASRNAGRSREKSRSKDKEFRDFRGRSRDRYRDKDHNRDRYKNDNWQDKDNDRHRKYRDNPYYNDFYRGEKGYSKEDDKWLGRDRYKSYDRDRDKFGRHRSKSSQRDSSYIDKKKLLEIARKNAIQMMKSGSLPGALTLGPQAQEKVIAAIKAGGKTVEELTDFCKTLSKKEELGELSSCSDENGGSDSDNDKPFHHPFQIKDRPTSITMNIKNSVPLPLKSTQERSTELRMQFPVSSGQQHRKTEEWVPVSTKSDSTKTTTTTTSVAPTTQSIPLPVEPVPPLPIEPAPPIEPPIVPAPPNAPPGPQVFPSPILEPSIDIGSIVSQRLTAMRKLQENPHDVQALTQIYKSNKEMQSWAESKQQPGQFTGSTGAHILTQAELSSGYQAWAKKDQLQSAAPVSGGMGMHLLQKMGWKPGEGLGKEKTGALEPLLLEVKLDKKGLVANEEQGKRAKKQKQANNVPTVKTLAGKHPVSLLGEYSSKRKLGAPQYNLCFECGPDHKKNFLFKVILNGVEYKPNIASPNKKEAKALAATICLQQLGLLP